MQANVFLQWQNMVWKGIIKAHINNTEMPDPACDVEASKAQTTSNLIMLLNHTDI